MKVKGIGNIGKNIGSYVCKIVIHSNLDLAVSDRLHRIRECQPVG